MKATDLIIRTILGEDDDEALWKEVMPVYDLELLSVGDQLMWRGAWGKEEPKVATVRCIEIDADDTKQGTEVQQVRWSEIRENGECDLERGAARDSS